MQEFIEKLIGRLEEERNKQQYLFNNVLNNDNQRMVHAYAEQCYLYMTEIVNQLAEEHNNDFCEWGRMKYLEFSLNDCITSCGHAEHYSTGIDKYCRHCGKKIKVVE